MIPAAGLGTRLGQDRTKALVEVHGKPIIQWQLEALPADVDVIVVAGYQARTVVDVAVALRRDVTIIINPDFRSTGTAASLALAAQAAGDWMLCMDGDLLVEPLSVEQMLRQNEATVGLVPRRTDTFVGVEVDDAGAATDMRFDLDSPHEWSGLLLASRQTVAAFGTGHVFESLRASLPVRTIEVDAHEIDTREDLASAREWLKHRTHDGRWRTKGA